MPAVEVETSIAASQPALFDLSQRADLRRAWDTFIRDSRYPDGIPAAGPVVGTRNWVRARNGLSMEVRYIAVKRPETVAMTMLRGPFFFSKFGGSWRFLPCANGTRVVFRYTFETRWRWLRPLLDRAIRAVFRRNIRRRLRGLKHAAEETDVLTRLTPDVDPR